MSLIELDVEIEGYSGPFDLLCSLVDDGKFKISEIKISQLIKIYGRYLIETRQSPADALAEFFYMTAGLLLEKTHSLLPGAKVIEEFSPQNEAEFMKSLERYKPYRRAYLWLSEKFFVQAKSFRREIPLEIPEREIVIDDEGAYMLAETWKILSKSFSQRQQERINFAEAEAKADWDGFAETDQEQIDARVSELDELLSMKFSLSFNEICASKQNAVITLLALLELCRLGRAEFSQDELFSDVRINSKN